MSFADFDKREIIVNSSQVELADKLFLELPDLLSKLTSSQRKTIFSQIDRHFCLNCGDKINECYCNRDLNN